MFFNHLIKKVNKYSIRKFSFGVASAMIGIGLIGGGFTTVSASDQPSFETGFERSYALNFRYVLHSELTEAQRQMIQSEIPKAKSANEETYYVVYRQAENQLPQTGDQINNLAIMLSAGMMVIGVSVLKDKKKQVISSILLMTAAGTVSVSALQSILSEYDQSYTLQVGEEMPTGIIHIENHQFVGYLMLEQQEISKVATNDDVPMTTERTILDEISTSSQSEALASNDMNEISAARASSDALSEEEKGTKSVNAQKNAAVDTQTENGSTMASVASNNAAIETEEITEASSVVQSGVTDSKIVNGNTSVSGSTYDKETDKKEPTPTSTVEQREVISEETKKEVTPPVVTVQSEFLNISLPFEEIVQYENTLSFDIQQIIRAGMLGSATVEYVNGIEVSRIIHQMPQAQVILQGTGPRIFTRTVNSDIPFGVVYQDESVADYASIMRVASQGYFGLKQTVYQVEQYADGTEVATVIVEEILQEPVDAVVVIEPNYEEDARDHIETIEEPVATSEVVAVESSYVDLDNIPIVSVDVSLEDIVVSEFVIETPVDEIVVNDLPTETEAETTENPTEVEATQVSTEEEETEVPEASATEEENTIEVPEETTVEEESTTEAPEATTEEESTTEAPETTTVEEESTTEEPEATTVEEENTTEAPEATTEEESTTEAPETTTEEESTTEAPETTTVEEESMTDAPETTTVEEESTTEVPEATTAEEESTTDAPETTTVEEESTTEAPEVTTEEESTTEAPEATTEEESTIEVPEATTEEESTTEAPEETTGEEESTTEVPEETTVEEESTTEAPEETTAEEESTTEVPEETTAEEESTTEVPEETTSVDKTPLETIVSEANQLNPEDYDTSTWAALQSALQIAQEVLMNEAVDLSNIETAVNQLRSAIEALAVEKSRLSSMLSTIETLTEAQFSPESWERLLEILVDGQSIYQDDAATQSSVNDVTNRLQGAMDQLEPLEQSENTREITRTIILKDDLDNELDRIVQTVEYQQEVTTNTVTGEQKTTEWKTENPIFDEVLLPTFDHYTTEQESIPSYTTTSDTEDLTVEVVYQSENDETIETKTVTRTINYRYRNLNEAAEAKVQELVFTRKLLTNKATGVTTPGEWQAESTVFEAVESPVLAGYEANPTVVEAVSIDGDTQDIVVEVIYEALKLIEIKDIDGVTLHQYSNGELTAKRFLTGVPADVTDYFVRVASDEMKEMLLPVASIEEVQIDGKTLYKINTELNALVEDQDLSKVSDYQEGRSFYISRAAEPSDNVYVSFPELIDAMIANPSGNFILGADLFADDMSINASRAAYVTNTFTGTLTGEHEGNSYAIYNLKASLFSTLSRATVQDLDLKNVQINAQNTSTGALVNLANNRTTVDNVSISGDVRGNREVGGFANVIVDSRFTNIVFDGTVTTNSTLAASRVGGIAASTSRGVIDQAEINVVVTTPGTNDNYRAGGVIGYIDGNGSVISNTHIKGQVINNGTSSRIGGITGDTYHGGGAHGSIDNIVSEVQVTNGYLINGYNNSPARFMRNIKVVEGIASGNDNAFDVEIITSEEAQVMVDGYQLTATLADTVNQAEQLNTLSTDYTLLVNASADRQTAYENIAKLMPFYLKEMIVEYGNMVSVEDKLYQTPLISVTPLSGSEIISDVNGNKENVNRIMLHYSDGTIDYLTVNYLSDFEQIAEYQIDGTDLLYTSKQFLSNYDTIIDAVLSELQSVDYHSEETIAKLGLGEKELMAQLYMEPKFDEVQASIDTLLRKVLSTDKSINTSEGVVEQYLIDYIKENKLELLMGLTYMLRWYDIEFGEVDFDQLVTFNQDFYGNPVSTLESLVDIAKLGFNNLRVYRNLETFNNNLAKNTNTNSLFEFLELNRELFVKDQTTNEWFKNATTAYIVEMPSTEVPGYDVSAWTQLTTNATEHNGVLPLLTAQEGVWMITVIGGTTYGRYDRFAGVAIEDVQAMVDQAAIWQRDYFDMVYRTVDEEARENLVNTHIPTWESYFSGSTWMPMYGETSQAILDFFGPIERGRIANNGSAAYANGTSVFYVTSSPLWAYGHSVYTHEVVHNIDGRVLFNGDGRRAGQRAEGFALGLFQSADRYTTNFITLNNTFDWSEHKDDPTRIQNVSFERFSDQAALDEYVTRMFDTLYVLSYLEAESVLALEQSELTKWYSSILNNYTMTTTTLVNGEVPQGSTNQVEVITARYKPEDTTVVTEDENGNEVTTTTTYAYNGGRISRLTDEQVAEMNLQSYQDLINNSLMSRREYNNGGNLTNNGYEVASMFSPIYSALSNDTGSVNSLMFKQLTYEVWAAGGYDAMVGYASNRYSAAAVEAGTTINDEFVLSQLFDGQYETWEAFKIAQYEKRIAQLANLKPVTIIYNNQEVTINSYEDLQALMADAVKADNDGGSPWVNNQSRVTQLKRLVYNAYLRLTDDFNESIFN